MAHLNSQEVTAGSELPLRGAKTESDRQFKVPFECVVNSPSGMRSLDPSALVHNLQMLTTVFHYGRFEEGPRIWYYPGRCEYSHVQQAHVIPHSVPRPAFRLRSNESISAGQQCARLAQRDRGSYSSGFSAAR
jgi:hypothetical protein